MVFQDVAYLRALGLPLAAAGIGGGGGGGGGDFEIAAAAEAPDDFKVADAAADALSEASEEEEDEDVLMTMDLGDGVTAEIPVQISSDFFVADFSVAGLAPTFDVSVVPLVAERATMEGMAFRLRCLDARTAWRVSSALGSLTVLPFERFLQRCGRDSAAPTAASEIAPVAAVTDVLRTALSSGAGVDLPPDYSSPEEYVCFYFDRLCESAPPPPEAFRSAMRISEVLPSIFCIQEPSDCVLGSTFLRVQEYYECPDDSFRRQCFSLEEYRDWCRSPKGPGRFDFYMKWHGFNLPSWVFDDLRRGCLGPLRPQEEALLQIVDQVASGLFYVIGCLPGQSATLRHEMAHGLYSINREYRSAADALIESMFSADERASLRNTLLGMGYCDVEEILTDEIQAYLASGDDLGCARPDAMQRLSANFDHFAAAAAAP